MAVPGTPLSSADAQKGKAASASGTMLKPMPTASDAPTMVALRVRLALADHVHAGDREAAKSRECHAAGRCVALCGQGPQKTKKPYTPARVYGEKTRMKNPHEFYDHIILQSKILSSAILKLHKCFFGAAYPLDTRRPGRYNNAVKFQVVFSGFRSSFCHTAIPFGLAVWLFYFPFRVREGRLEEVLSMNTVQHDLLTLIRTRRSVRAYKPDPVPADLLDAVLEAGTWAPTGGGRQSPTIVAVTDPAARRQIAALKARVMGSDTDPYYGAPAVVLVLADGASRTFVEDGSCVLENIMLAAHALGLGTVWVHREREIFDSEEGKALLRAWHLPETLRGVGAVALGYPAVEPGDPAPRKAGYIVRI